MLRHWPECRDPLGDRVRRADQGLRQCIVHLQIAFVFSEVALVVRLVEHPPLRGFQPERMRQALKHQITVLGTVATPAQRRQRQGIQTFDQALFELYEAGMISYEDALRNADSLNDLRLKIKLHGQEAKGRDMMAGLDHLDIV